MKYILAGFIVAIIMAFPASASAQSASGIRYVALGDSVAAGIGLPGAGTTADDQRCGRTASAYPSLLARSLDTSVVNLACSGARVNEGFLAEPKDNSVLGAQLGPAFATGTPDVITITAGANDTRWSNFVWYCTLRTQRDCGSWAQNATLKILRTDLAFETRQLLSRIERSSNGRPPKVLLNGYYTPFSEQLACGDTAGLSLQDIRWLNSQVAQLNGTLQAASKSYDFATFVPVNFNGHELCSADPWVQGRSALAPFHPTARGQQAIAEANLRAYR